VQDLRWADPHAVSLTNFLYDSEFQKLILNWNRPKDLIHGGLRSIILDRNSVVNGGQGPMFDDAFARKAEEYHEVPQ
jgi:hypothetical protein